MFLVFTNFLMAYVIGLGVILTSLYLNFNYIYRNSLNLQVLLQDYVTLNTQKQRKIRERLLPFECGFKPFVNNRNPMTVEFFAIMLLFLIFDLEILSMLPSVNFSTLNSYFFSNDFSLNSLGLNSLLVLFIFITFVLLGLYDEKRSNLIVKLKLKTFR